MKARIKLLIVSDMKSPRLTELKMSWLTAMQRSAEPRPHEYVTHHLDPKTLSSMWGECLLACNKPDKHLHAELNSQSLEFCIVFGVSAEIHSGLKKCLFAAVHTDISRVCIASVDVSFCLFILKKRDLHHTLQKWCHSQTPTVWLIIGVLWVFVSP